MQDYVQPGGRGGNELRKVGQGGLPRTHREGNPADFCRFRSFNGIGLFPRNLFSIVDSKVFSRISFPPRLFARSSGTWLRAGRNSRVTRWPAKRGTEKLSNDVELDVKC